MNENKIQAYFKEPVKFRGNRHKQILDNSID